MANSPGRGCSRAHAGASGAARAGNHQRLAHLEGELATAQAAATRWVSGHGAQRQSSVHDAEAGGDTSSRRESGLGRWIPGLHPWPDRDFTLALVRRTRAAGCQAPGATTVPPDAPPSRRARPDDAAGTRLRQACCSGACARRLTPALLPGQSAPLSAAPLAANTPTWDACGTGWSATPGRRCCSGGITPHWMTRGWRGPARRRHWSYLQPRRALDADYHRPPTAELLPPLYRRGGGRATGAGRRRQTPYCTPMRAWALAVGASGARGPPAGARAGGWPARAGRGPHAAPAGARRAGQLRWH